MTENYNTVLVIALHDATVLMSEELTFAELGTFLVFDGNGKIVYCIHKVVPLNGKATDVTKNGS